MASFRFWFVIFVAMLVVVTVHGDPVLGHLLFGKGKGGGYGGGHEGGYGGGHEGGHKEEGYSASSASAGSAAHGHNSHSESHAASFSFGGISSSFASSYSSADPGSDY